MIFWMTLIVFTQLAATVTVEKDAASLKTILSDIIEKSNGASIYQNYIYEMHPVESTLDGQLLLDQFRSALEESFQGVFKAIKKTKAAIESDYINNIYRRGLSETYSRQCCHIATDDLVWSKEFLKRIGTETVCLRISKDAAETSLIPYSQRITDVMKNNRITHKDIKWQYYGSEEGTFVKYPQSKDARCDAYDPRYRPWYAETASNHPKDVVVVLDRSASIAKTGLLSIMKKAVRDLILTLNANDRIGVVAFDEVAYRPAGTDHMRCYYDHLAFATDVNKKYLISWLNEIRNGSFSNYKVAMEAAFDYFDKAEDVGEDHRKRYRVIVFLGDGKPGYIPGYSDTIMKVIHERNAELNNSVSIVTYGIGSSLSQEGEALLINMAGKGKPGMFRRINASTDLRAEIGSYYNIFDRNNDTEPVITTPYVDFSGLGMIISVCLPVRHGGVLRGVTCLDMSLTEMTKNIAELHHGRNSYAFISDYNSKIILHPLMPSPLIYGFSSNINIRHLETDADVEGIIDKMKSLTSGIKSVIKKFVRPRGNTTTDGVKTQNLNAMYAWDKIRNSSFSIAVVTTESDVNITISNTNLASKKFVYHRLDLVDNVMKCSSHGRLSTKEHSVVKLTEDAFVDRLYYNSPETKEVINIYTGYMEDRHQQTNDRIRWITKQMISISERLEEIWKQKTELDGIVVWRYYGDYYGHIRIYPGVALPKEYDHTQRAFFWKAVNNIDEITVTPPYLDAFGAGVVCTIVVRIFSQDRGISRSTNRPNVLGILALDIKMSYIKHLLEKTFPACVSENNICFIMDNSGYLVYHPEVEYRTNNRTANVYDYHIADLEPQIAMYLIYKGHLTRNVCTDFGYKKRLQTWKMSLDNPIQFYNTAPYFDMFKVNGTNLFFGRKNKTADAGKSCSCPKRTTNRASTWHECPKEECSCPCVKDADFDFCRNAFSSDEQHSPPCVPQPPSIGFKNPIPNEDVLIRDLSACHYFNCTEKKSKTTCLLSESCTWCQDTLECTFGRCPPKSDPIHTIIGGTIGGVLFIVILIVIFVALKRGACKSSTTPKPEDFRPASEFGLSPRVDEPDLSSPDIINQRYIS